MNKLYKRIKNMLQVIVNTNNSPIVRGLKYKHSQCAEHLVEPSSTIYDFFDNNLKDIIAWCYEMDNHHLHVTCRTYDLLDAMTINVYLNGFGSTLQKNDFNETFAQHYSKIAKMRGSIFRRYDPLSSIVFGISNNHDKYIYVCKLSDQNNIYVDVGSNAVLNVIKYCNDHNFANFDEQCAVKINDDYVPTDRLLEKCMDFNRINGIAPFLNICEMFKMHKTNCLECGLL